MEETSVSVLVNQTRGLEDEGLGPMITRGCLDYFDLEVRSLGFIRYDENVKDSVRKQRPLTIHFSDSLTAGGFKDCVRKLIKDSRRTARA
jgi:MinD-like ATPase involved in chromosome partitioning or flagellar assembly